MATTSVASDTIVIELLGHPRGKGRPRHARLPSGAVLTHTNPKIAEFEANLKFAVKAMPGRPPLNGPVVLMLEAFFPIPQSWTQKR